MYYPLFNVITNNTINKLRPMPPQILISIDRSNIAIQPRESSLHRRIQALHVVRIQLRRLKISFFGDVHIQQ